MNFDPKAVRRALMVAKNLATQIDPGFAVHNLPMPPQGVPLERAEGGAVDDHPDQGYSPKPAGVLDVDNPGGDWLKENREYSESRGYLPSGAPKSFGKVTAVWRKPEKLNDTAPVYLPVSMLAKLPGVMGEQSNVRENDLNWLVDHMGKTGKLPKTDGREYHPFITVDHRGMPFVSEGNHRIMAAAKLGWDYLPVEVRYFNGAENVDGPLHPDRLKAMHAPQKAAGGEVKNVLPVDSEERATNLKNWLGKSFLHVDGNPRTYYHGTSKDQPFTGFKIGRHGAWFTSDPKEASMYAEANDSMRRRFESGRFVPQNTASRVMPVYLKASNPFFGEFPEKYKNVENYKKAQSDWFDELRAAGYDSWIPRLQEGNLAVMLEGPHQVKSAIGNDGTFDHPTDIAKAGGGEVEAAGMGINVRSDSKAGIRYADEIVDGNKKYETRDSDSLRPYVGKRVAIVRTGEGPAKAIGEVTVGEPIVADRDMFHKMRPHHLVPEGSMFDIKPGSQKYLYPMHDPVRFDAEKGVGAGIVARKVLSKSEGGALTDDTPPRRLNPMGMYSAAAEAALNLPQDRGTPQQMIASLKGVKPDEIKFSDVENAFANKPLVTKQELAEYFHRNVPKIDVDTLDEESGEAAKNRYEDFMLTMGGKESNYNEDLIKWADPYSLTLTRKPATQKKPFRGEHYNDSNILAHVRRSDRTGPNGEKLLHIEELQSDWGQKGKEVGFENPIVPGAVVEDSEFPGTFRVNWQNGRYSAGFGTREIAEGVAKEGAALRSNYVPSHPYVTTTNRWMDLALKNVLNRAAKKGYDGIIWTPGDKQVERYDLSKEEDGGAGMKYFYDKMVPKQLLGLAKEHNSTANIESLSAQHDPVVDGFPMMRITPQMRESIKKRGFKAFGRGGTAENDVTYRGKESAPVSVPVIDRAKAIRRALMIAKDDGGSITGAQPEQAPQANITPTSNPKRILVNAEGKGGVRGIVVPKHMWEGTDKASGMRDINKARAEVYGAENRDPLTIGQIGKVHKQVLDDHFDKPVDQQIAAEKAALQRLQQARHINKGADTLDESEKLDTVRHETDDAGRTYVAYGSKGIAGHALYTSGYGPNQKQVVLNTCPGQTTGCGGGVGPDGIVDTMRGTCFAPNAESQYVNAAVRRACHAQAKHDPAMTRDWILAHTGALRNAAAKADKNNQVVLFRPNVVDESDTSSRYVISNLNKQREEAGKPGIIANSYGKTNELHDPENGYFVTYSNAGPKTKLGYSVGENISRDKSRIRSTIMATDAAGRDFQNEQGNNTPPKNSYLVTDVKRGSDLNGRMEKAIKYAKYWSAGRPANDLSPEEIAEGPEGHFDGNGDATTPDKAHYGHITLNDRRYDYQKQHILHPRLVQVGLNDDGTPHMIPTDSRFKDNEYLPKNRFMTKNGKEAGAILMTTPTTSTSNLGHQTSFTHHVDDDDLAYAKKNKGEYEIDSPQDQESSMGREYVAPQEIKFRADGGAVDARYADDDLAGFPEQSLAVQMHNAHRHEEHSEAHHHHGRQQAFNIINPDVSRALQLTRGFGMVPGMIPPYGRR
jgi:hypothetical protein